MPNQSKSGRLAGSRGRCRTSAAIIIAGGGLMNIHYASIVDFAAKQRLPVMSTDPRAVGVGALMSYSSLFAAQYRGAAIYVDKILKGTNPGDLPVVQLTRSELVINQKTAKALGITLPQSILVRADRVID
jgi:putative ABC transport system substrate-binding protein